MPDIKDDYNRKDNRDLQEIIKQVSTIISMECEKCGAVYSVEYKTYERHQKQCTCPFCKHTETVEIGDE